MGQRLRFRARFGRHGLRTNWNGYAERTFLFTDVKLTEESNATVLAHIWFKDLKVLQGLGDLAPGDEIEFSARVDTTKKGYRGQREAAAFENPPRMAVTLSHPTKAIKLCE